MNENETFEDIDIDDLVESVGYQFIDFLAEENMVSESFTRKIKALVEIDLSNDKGELLTEAVDAAHYEKDGIKVPGESVIVPYDKFKQIWEDPDNYPTQYDILIAFGISRAKVQGMKTGTLGRNIRRMLKAYNISNFNKNDNLPSFAKRKSRFSKASNEFDRMFQQEPPDRNDIHNGNRNRRNQTTTTLDRVNAQELLHGELYANISRIPKSRWAGWLRFWDRRKTRVAPNRGSGRKWEKHFLMGYQIDRNILFEIWYNTLDSTFSIHDKNGTELGRPVLTLQEAMKYFVTQITTASEQDAEVFSAGGVNNQVVNSMMRGVTLRLSGDAAEAEREAQLRKKSEQDMEYFNDVAKEYSAIKYAKKMRRGERVENLKTIFKNAMEVPTNLQRSAYIKMMNTSNDLSDKVSIALRSAFETAINKAKDEKELQGIMASQLRDYLKDDIESGAEIMKMSKEYIKDPAVRAEINKRFSEGDEEEVERRREEVRDRVKDAEAKFREENERRKREQDEKTRKERERAEAKGKKALGDKYNVLDRRNKRAQKNGQADELDIARSNKHTEKVVNKYRRNLGMNESINEMLEEQFGMNVQDIDMETAADEIQRELDSQRMDSQAQSLRNMAEKSPYTQAALSSSVMSDMLRTYTATRAPQSMGQSRFVQWIKKKIFKPNRGKVLPTDPSPYWDRLKQKFTGKTSRADFIIGYTLNDKVNVEIWYVTEWDSDQNKMVSSFHVFDVTAAKVVRRYLPYYRTAIQVAMSKIGLTV